MSEALKKEFKGANQIIDILFSGDPSREDYKKVIANLNLTMQSAESVEPLSLYFYILSEMCADRFAGAVAQLSVLSQLDAATARGTDAVDLCRLLLLRAADGPGGSASAYGDGRDAVCVDAQFRRRTHPRLSDGAHAIRLGRFVCVQ